MQSIYAYEQCKKSNYYLAIDKVSLAFQPDLNSMEVQNKPLLKTQEKESTSLFKKYFNDEQFPSEECSTEKIHEVVSQAIAQYHKEIKKDREYLRKTMLRDAEKIIDRFAWLMFAPSALLEASTREKHRKNLPKLDHFISNKILKSISSNKILDGKLEKSKLQWVDHSEEVKIWVHEILNKDVAFLSYLEKDTTTLEDDRSIVLHMFKNIIFKNELVSQFMEKVDLYWSENEAILKSMITKTIKNIDSETGEFELAELSYNWEDDKVFFDTIYEKTLAHEDEYEELIAQKAKNWDIERIAGTDKILLKMAIQEMINFPAIPVKVTINEYIEISKRYSTPKSKQFVNGVLDVIALDLQESGVIKKSGRGLIDNK